MAETITIAIDSLKERVKGSLAMTGKRLSAQDGNTLYTSTTLSTAEEKYLATYIREGVAVFLGEFAPLVTGYAEEETINVTFHVPRVNEAKVSVFGQCLDSYVDAFCQLKVFGLSLAEAARRNKEEEMQTHLSAAVKLIFSPDPPEQGGKTLADMTGDIMFKTETKP